MKPALGIATEGSPGTDDPRTDLPSAFKWERELRRIGVLADWLEKVSHRVDVLVMRLERALVSLDASTPWAKKDEATTVPTGNGTPLIPQEEGDQALTNISQGILTEEDKKQAAAHQKRIDLMLDREAMRRKERMAYAQECLDKWKDEGGPSEEDLEEYCSRWMKLG